MEQVQKAKRKSKEQVAQERKARQESRAALSQAEFEERIELEIQQRKERQQLKEKQAKRRIANTTTKAGGRRAGAGRKPTLPHVSSIIAGEDLNPRKTFTFYGAADEKEPVKDFLKMWRELRFNTPDKYIKLSQLRGDTVYKLLTSGTLDQHESDLLTQLLPNVIAIRS